MKRLFKNCFRNLETRRTGIRYFSGTNKLNVKKVETVKNVPEKSISYEKKLDDIFSVVSELHHNNNFLKIFYYRFFRSIKHYKDTEYTEEIGKLIFSHSSSRRYYLINALFLGSYMLYSYFINKNEDVPSSIKNTSLGFSIIAGSALLGMLYFSRRHVKMIYFHKNSKNFEIITYNYLGLINRKHNIAVKDLKRVVPLVKGRLQQKSGIFSMEFLVSGKKENFYFRPLEIVNKELFDILIKKKMEI
jgi:hypothetical protein